MNKSFSLDSSNFKTTNYLSNYDLQAKYNLNSIYQCPKFTKLVLTFNLLDSLNIDDQIKYYFTFFFSLGVLPYLQIKKLLNKLQISLKVFLISNKEINTFFLNFFLEKSKYFNTFLNPQKNNNLKVNCLTNSNIILNLFFSELFNINKFFEISDKNLKISINLFLKFYYTRHLNLYTTLKNLPFFWKIK
jgi:hypothetical protein